MKGMDLARELFDFIHAVTLGLETVLLPSLEAHGLTMIQSRLLIEIYINKKTTVGSLCSRIGSSSGNASTACKKLEKKGYIKRTRDSLDERVVNIELTELGIKTLHMIDQELQEKYGPTLSGTTADDFNDLIVCMKKMKGFLVKFGSN